ncbi:MAG TPA: methyltransferase domain-containing protein [Chitinophagaceae bacterium]|jgi:SAM-dependent methyltransferase|nr:methyltransferase domain-containing protein [Chitinophagaceae bacterium]
MSFARRSYQKELLDGEGIPFADIRRNMEELETINRLLGGHRITIKGVEALLPAGDEPVRIAEIGCGGGDNLRMIGNWLQRKGRTAELTGIDINGECIAYARSRSSSIRFIHSDYRTALLPETPHIVFSSLFCHHFTDEQLEEVLHWKAAHCRSGFFINDLHRHPLAFHSIRLLTGLFSKSYLVKNDAPLSVKRGFRRQDWERLFARAGLKEYSCRWQWAFRWLAVWRNAQV